MMSNIHVRMTALTAEQSASTAVRSTLSQQVILNYKSFGAVRASKSRV